MKVNTAITIQDKVNNNPKSSTQRPDLAQLVGCLVSNWQDKLFSMSPFSIMLLAASESGWFWEPSLQLEVSMIRREFPFILEDSLGSSSDWWWLVNMLAISFNSWLLVWLIACSGDVVSIMTSQACDLSELAQTNSVCLLIWDTVQRYRKYATEKPAQYMQFIMQPSYVFNIVK